MAINILECYRTPPPPRQYVLPGMIPGTVGSIVAPGGQGKSMLAVQLAHCIAGGVDLLGLGKQVQGKVAYLSAEDGQDVLHERLHQIGTRLREDQREACAENLVIEDITKHTPDLKNEKWVEAVERLATDKRLLFLDTLRSFHSGDENNGTEMSVLIGSLRAMAARTKCAIVFLHHSSKALAVAGQGDIQQASRGSSVLTDNIRWQSYLSGMTQDEAKKYGIENSERSYYTRFGVSKQNYGAPFDERWFKRGQGGVLEPTEVKEVKELRRRGRYDL